MKMLKIFIFLFISVQLFSNQSFFKISSKYKNLKLIDKWIFESSETTINAEEEEKVFVYKDDKNIETITFDKSGVMSYNSMEEGERKKGEGQWLVKENRLRIIVETDTINAIYYIEQDLLTIVTESEESEEFYGNKMIVKYKK